MIPKSLHIDGFLSYQSPVTIDLSGLHLACITGHNGAGKSSLLDAMTWALFGQARARGEDVINLGRQEAEVSFTFLYENTPYRIIRRLERGKGSSLEFQIQREDAQWKTLSERSIRATQSQIERTLRLDYGTFVNAVFFLQGHADQFTQQTPSARKEILGRILGLETWEAYRQKAAAQRQGIETRRERIDAEIESIDRELAEEPQRLADLKAKQQALQSLRENLQNQESLLQQANELHATLESQRQMVSALEKSLQQAEAAQENRQNRLADLETRAKSYAELMAQAEDIRSQHAELQALRLKLQEFESLAARFHDQENARQKPQAIIAAEKARLEEERAALQRQQDEAARQQDEITALQDEKARLQAEITALEKEAAHIETLRQQALDEREAYQTLNTTVHTLKQATHDIKERITTLQNSQSSQCPTCGQPLTDEHKATLIAALEAEGREKAEAFRRQREQMEAMRQQHEANEKAIRAWEQEGQRRLDALRLHMARLDEKLSQKNAWITEWQQTGLPRLQSLTRQIETDDFAHDARQQLAAIDAQLQALGYDSRAHQEARQRAETLAVAEEQMRELATAEASLREINHQISSLQAEITAAETALKAQRDQWQQQAAQLAASETRLPDRDALQQELLHLKEAVNRQERELGAAEQKVRVLDDLRQRKAALQKQRTDLSLTIARYQQLEKAFGKNGAPALIIEQALPQIEEHANQILQRLSDGQMSLRFKTQAEYKDKKRKDLKETLEIEISDSAGTRGYEMFSGGEAFRINFAVRLALSKVLAQRKGARLQMLVIDEGFGSQDALGKQRLIEAINAIQNDFATILVITHLEELKDAFPARIEISKTPSGSMVTIS